MVKSDFPGLDVVILCRSLFILAAATDLIVHSVPALQQRCMEYGSRQFVPKASETAPAKVDDWKLSILDKLSALQMPHSWFIHFYIVSVLSSAFWGQQLWTRGPAFQAMASLSLSNINAMSVEQVILAWAVLMLHGCRRLYECISLYRPSNAKMPLPGWIVGICFYVGIGVSVWVEGISRLAADDSTLSELTFKTLPAISLIGLLIFSVASAVQHICHAHLASLPKYSLPRHIFFQHILCPHYTSECVIYLAIALIAAPTGQRLNKTIICALFFVSANLGVTAQSSKVWYTNRFGREQIRGRWRMIPYLY